MSESNREREKKIISYELFYTVIFSGIFLLDQFIKRLVCLYFLPGKGFPIIKNFFHITLVFNRGIAFGLFSNIPIFFLILATIFFIGILLFPDRNFFHKNKLAIYFIGTGALSNLLDRIRFGYVIDYLDFRIWPVFNLADASITLGVILFSWKIIKSNI